MQHDQGLGFPMHSFSFFTTVIVEFQARIPVLTEVLAVYVMLFHSVESFLSKLREAEEPQPPR